MEYGVKLRDCTSYGQPAVTSMEEIEASNLIVNFGSGHWLYGPLWTTVGHRIADWYTNALRQRLGFEEWTFSRAIPKDALDSFELTHYRPGMLIAASTYNGEATTPERILDPVQCLPLYEMHRNAILDVASGPISVVEHRGGWTWREEAADELDGPIRAREFARIEAAFIGTPSQVVNLRQRVEDLMLELIDLLRISSRVVVGVGCMEISELDERRREALSATDVPVHDVEVRVRDSEWLEIAGCTVEGRHLVANFGISAKGVDLWSGCCGLGMNRLISVLFMTHGVSPEMWPRDLTQWVFDSAPQEPGS